MSVQDKPDPFLVQKPSRDRILPGESAGKSREAFRSIGEAAAELGLKTHVLRFWETKFDALKPMKRADGRRYYRPEDMETLRRLQDLLHVQGLTIRGAARVLAGGEPGEADAVDDQDAADFEDASASVRGLQGAVRDAVERGEFRAAAESADENDPGAVARSRLESLLSDLSDLKSRLDAVRNAA